MHGEKGLCFNCDEKFTRGHCCSSKLFLFIADEDELDPNDLPHEEFVQEATDQDDKSPAQISFHAICGHLAPETLRLVGTIYDSNVVVLIDSRSTHNFLQERLVTTLGLRVQPTQMLQVMVGNDSEIDCLQVCRDVILHIQGHRFTVNFHVLPLGGTDLVLGVQWLKSLGPVLTDYADLTMKFMQHGHVVELQGKREANIHSVNHHQLQRMVQTNGVSTLFHIRLTTPEPPSTQISTLNNHSPEIESILHRYTFLLQTPTTLPPNHETNLTINLLPHLTPVNVRPYRYPHFSVIGNRILGGDHAA